MTKLEPTRTSSDPTATERLRELLDERGVEYGALSSIFTTWTGGVCSWIAIEDKDGLAVAVYRDYLTPEQAIAATLGSCSLPCNCTNGGRTDGTCHAEGFDDGVDEGMDGEWYSYSPPTWYLSCGHEVHESECPRFCPVCGREVVGE